MIKHVYVAGPITRGNYINNIRAGVLAGERLRAEGLVPFIPHLSALWELIAPMGYEEIMAVDFAWILRCDALLRMPGESPGAEREVAFALANGIPVFYSEADLLAAAFPCPLV
jgi:nucleoside 2-deoxyribosyltransferase